MSKFTCKYLDRQYLFVLLHLCFGRIAIGFFYLFDSRLSAQMTPIIQEEDGQIITIIIITDWNFNDYHNDDDDG